MDEADSDQNLFNALYPFRSGNLPRTRHGAVFTRSVFFMSSCRDEMRLNWQCRGPHSTHQQWLTSFNDWRRQAIHAVESMESELGKLHRRAKRFIRQRPVGDGEESLELMAPTSEQEIEQQISDLERSLESSASRGVTGVQPRS